MLGRYYEDFPIDQTHHTGNITQMYKQEAVEFITRDRAGSESASKPFFLYFTPDNTHGPTYKDRQFEGKSRRQCSYGDSLLEIDEVVESIFEAIVSTPGVANNTIVFFSSDNGAARQSHEEGGSNFPFLCGKETTFDGGLREPTFVWWPGRIESGSYNRGPSMLTDLFPTIANLAGVESPRDRAIDGVSMMNAMFKGTEDQTRPVYHWRGDRLMAVRVGDYKGHFWAWANGWDEYPNIDFCPGEDVPGLTVRVPANYTTRPMIVNIVRDAGERFAINNRTSEYKMASDVLLKAYHDHLDHMVYAEPALNWCDNAAQHWAPPGCEALGKCLPVPESNPTLCDWPH